MNSSKKIINLDNPKSIIEFLQQPAIKLGEFITGLLVSNTKDYTKRGKINENYLDEDLNKKALADLLKFIDDTSPVEDRFNAMKALFLKSVSCDSTQEEKTLSYQFMKICRKLESSDLLILKAAYDIKYHRFNKKLVTTGVNHKAILTIQIAHTWLTTISDQIGHGIISLIEVQEEKLISLKLIGPRIASDKSGIRANKNFRLTDLGCRICDFIYEK